MTETVSLQNLSPQPTLWCAQQWTVGHQSLSWLCLWLHQKQRLLMRQKLHASSASWGTCSHVPTFWYLSVRMCYTKSSNIQRRNRNENHSFHYFLPYETYLGMCTGWAHDVAANWIYFKARLKYGQSIQTPSPRLRVCAGAGGAMCSSPGAALWLQPQKIKEGNAKIHMGRNRRKGLCDVTLDLEAWLGHPWRNIMVLQDAALVG